VLNSLTVVIACKNRNEHIKYCVHSILQGDAVPKIAVVDFGSDMPVPLLDTDHIKVIRANRDTQVFHKARALNIGIRMVSTKFTCITDADQIFAPNFFSIVWQQLNAAPKIFVRSKTHFLLGAGCTADPSEGETALSDFSQAGITAEAIGNSYPSILAQAQKVKPRGYGCCHGVATSWLLKVHGYDETYFGWGAEDRDLEVRAGYDGFRFVWANEYSSMVHLPHPKQGEYYDQARIEKNLAKYEALNSLTEDNHKKDSIVVNENITWGAL